MGTITAAVEAAPRNGVVTIDINSLGGNGFNLLQMLAVSEAAWDRHVTVACVVRGIAASAAAIFFSAGCDVRIMHSSAHLLFHKAYVKKPFILGAVTPEEQRDVGKLNEVISSIISQHSGLSVYEYNSHVNNGDWYVSAAEAVRLGLADTVVPGRPVKSNTYDPTP